MTNDAFIVDRKLGAVPVARLLDVRASLRGNATIGLQLSVAGDRPVLTGSETLQPDTLYASEKNQALRYYLPKYRVSVGETGRPAVELRFGEGDAGEVGRLTLTLTWTNPQAVMLLAAGAEVRAMDHIAALALRYRVAVQADGTAISTNVSAGEQTVPLQPLQQFGSQLARSTTIFTDKAQFDAVYQALKEPDHGATLEVQIMAHVGVRTWRQVLVGRPAFKDQATVLKNRGVLFTQMLHKESLATMRTGPASSAARVKLTAPPPAVTTRVEATRVDLARPEPARRMAPAVAAREARMQVVAPGVAARPMAARVPTADTPPTRRADLGTTDTATPAERVVPAHVGIHAVAAQPQVSSATLARLNTPKLSQAVSRSDLKIAGRRAVPINLALDTEQVPAIIECDLENTQLLPFGFDPSENPHVLAVDDFRSGGIHLLLERTLIKPDLSKCVVYQDNLMRDVVHIVPSGFRLDRDATAPFLPAISFLASEFSTTDNDQEAEVLFRVAAVYRLEPWFDPDVVELARAQIAAEGLVARFTTAVSHDATLSLNLDLLGDEQPQPRKAATVDPATGVTDTLDLDHNTFVRLWRERLANPAGGGVRGQVDYKLFDGSQARVPVLLSLWETSAELFNVAFVGPVSGHPGRYRVLVRNRVESPARITGLPGEIVVGKLARAADPAAILGQILQPEETRQIDYDLDATAGPIVLFEPTVLGQAEANLPALLKLLMVTPGYTALGFSLTVKAAAGAFVPPVGGAEPLTGLLVEFDDGTRANLSNTEPAEVTLVGRLTDQILGTADDSQRYFYRVTNLHASGEGARTSWREGHGTSALEVGTAVVTLDF